MNIHTLPLELVIEIFNNIPVSSLPRIYNMLDNTIILKIIRSIIFKQVNLIIAPNLRSIFGSSKCFAISIDKDILEIAVLQNKNGEVLYLTINDFIKFNEKFDDFVKDINIEYYFTKHKTSTISIDNDLSCLLMILSNHNNKNIKCDLLTNQSIKYKDCTNKK